MSEPPVGRSVATPTVDLRAVHKDWPRATPQDARACSEGGRRCCRCQAMLDAGVNPYTMEPLARSVEHTPWERA